MRIVFLILSIFFIFLYCTSDKPTPPDNYGDNSNIPPYCEISFPDDGDTLIIGNIYISVDAYDDDGYIECIEFYIEDELVLADRSEFHIYISISPWIKSGFFEIKAIAIDDDSASTESLISAYFALFMPVNPSPDTLFVAQNYTSIQTAIDNSQAGDVILIADGWYNENISIHHPISLIGSGENTVIDDKVIFIESDNVIIKNIRVYPYSGYVSGYNGSPGISIRNSDYILIDSVTCQGAPYNIWFDPVYPDYYHCTYGGPGLKILNSSKITIQNSIILGGLSDDPECFLGTPWAGPGSRINNGASIFFVMSNIEGGYDEAHGLEASNYSYIGIRNCIVEGRGYLEDYNIDSTSTVIFP